MAGIVVGMEADQIAVEDANEKRLADGKDTVDFRAGERGVEEEANLDVLFRVANLLTQHLW